MWTKRLWRMANVIISSVRALRMRSIEMIGIVVRISDAITLAKHIWITVGFRRSCKYDWNFINQNSSIASEKEFAGYFNAFPNNVKYIRASLRCFDYFAMIFLAQIIVQVVLKSNRCTEKHSGGEGEHDMVIAISCFADGIDRMMQQYISNQFQYEKWSSRKLFSRNLSVQSAVVQGHRLLCALRESNGNGKWFS